MAPEKLSLAGAVAGPLFFSPEMCPPAAAQKNMLFAEFPARFVSRAHLRLPASSFVFSKLRRNGRSFLPPSNFIFFKFFSQLSAIFSSVSARMRNASCAAWALALSRGVPAVGRPVQLALQLALQPAVQLALQLAVQLAVRLAAPLADNEEARGIGPANPAIAFFFGISQAWPRVSEWHGARGRTSWLHSAGCASVQEALQLAAQPAAQQRAPRQLHISSRPSDFFSKALVSPVHLHFFSSAFPVMLFRTWSGQQL
jgi:hypothetical protein